MHSRLWNFFNIFNPNKVDDVKESKPNRIGDLPQVLNMEVSGYLHSTDAVNFSMTTQRLYRRTHMDRTFWSMHIKPGYHYLLNNLNETNDHPLLTVDAYKETYYLVANKLMPLLEGVLFVSIKELSSKDIWKHLDLKNTTTVTVFSNRSEAIKQADLCSLSVISSGYYAYPIVCTVTLKDVDNVQQKAAMLETSATNIAKIHQFFYKAGPRSINSVGEIFDKEFDQRVVKR